MAFSFTEPTPKHFWLYALGYLAAIFTLLFFSSCTTVYERGQKLAVIGSNVKGLHLVSAQGTTLDIASVDNAAIHRAAGAATSAAALGIGSGVASSGLLGIFR
jgi:hypothetical protein